MSELHLPPSWVTTSLEQMSWIEMGQSPDSSSYNSEGDGLPFFQGKAEFRTLFPEIRKWCVAPSKIVERGDILLSIRAPVGPTNIAPARSCIGRGLAGLRGEVGINQKYFFYFLRSIEQWLSQQGTGSTFAAVSGQFVRDIEIPIAPSAEQTRIVTKLEELLSDLDAGVAELKAAQKKLTQYRQSLLKAAVEGALTAEWRANNPPTETGAQLLERILQERRARWEAKQLAKFKEQGKAPPKDWQKKYPEPVQPETTDLPELPQGWVWASVDQLTEFITSGSRGWADYYADAGATFIRSQNINKDWLDLSEIAFVTPPKGSEGARTRVQKNDVLLTITGANVGKTAHVEADMDEAYVSQHVALIRPVEMALSKVLHLFLTAEAGGRGQLNKEAYGAGKPGLNLQQVAAVCVPLASPSEIEALLKAVDAQLEAATAKLVAIKMALKKSTAQRQNILKAAFSGQLVPQDPSDEPASELLARIRADRAAQQAVKKPRGRKAKESA